MNRLRVPSQLVQIKISRLIRRGSADLRTRAGVSYVSGDCTYLVGADSDLLPYSVSWNPQIPIAAGLEVNLDLSTQVAVAWLDCEPISLEIVGAHLGNTSRLTTPQNLDLSRLIGAIGGVGAGRIASSNIVIVGCGGIGSMMSELLARGGAQRMTLVDPDKVELHNLTRMIGVLPENLGQPKVISLANQAERLSGVHPKEHPEAFGKIELRLALRDADLIIVCTDDVPSRRLCATFASDYLIPCLCVGTGVLNDGVGIEIGLGLPGEACLNCLMRLPQSGSFEFVTERLGSLASLNSIAAGMAMRLIEEFAIGRVLQSVYLRYAWHDGLVVLPAVRPHIVCPCRSRFGCGDYVCSITKTLLKILETRWNSVPIELRFTYMGSQPRPREYFTDWQIPPDDAGVQPEDQMLTLLRVSPTYMHLDDLRLYLDFRDGFRSDFGDTALFRLEAELLQIEDGPLHLVRALTSANGSPETSEIAIAMARLNSARARVSDHDHDLALKPLDRRVHVRQILDAWMVNRKVS